MTASSFDLSDRGDLRSLAQLVAAIRQAKPDARFLLIGAMARDLLTWYAHGIRAQRATEDVDFAFAVPDWRAYEDLKGALVSSGDFVEASRTAYRLLFAGDRKVDLVPFGGVESPVGQIDWPAPQDTRMVVLGFREAIDSAVELTLPSGVSIAVASLPAQAVLKLFAWGDRRHVQLGKDAADLNFLLRNYLDAGNRERLYSEAAHLLDAEDYDDELAGAWMFGADARQLLIAKDGEDNASLIAALMLLENDTTEGPVHLATDMRALDLQHAVDLLKAFHAGLMGAREVDRH